MDALHLRRAFLLLVIGSLSFAALLGVGVMLFSPNFGHLAGCTIATALTITLFSVISLGCAWAWERERRRIPAIAGLVLSGISFVVFEVLIWGEQYMQWEWEEVIAKAMGLGTVWSVLMALFCMLGLARLRRGWMWINVATQTIAWVLAVVLTPVIAYELDDDITLRLIGVLGILTACGTICVPILHRLSAMPAVEPLVTTTLVLTIVCPRCTTRQEVPAGRSHCGECGLRFNIEIEEEHCQNCGYVLYKLTSDRCPECGLPIAARPGTPGQALPPDNQDTERT